MKFIAGRLKQKAIFPVFMKKKGAVSKISG